MQKALLKPINIKSLRNTMKNQTAFLVHIIALFFFTVTTAQSEITSEDLLVMNDSIQLPGTLSYNSTLKKQPLAIFIHGSGGVDRNGNQGPMAKPSYITQLGEALNKNGIAFYRYDKRTSNKENAKFFMKGVSLDDFVDDAKLIINNFKADKRFSSITLIGHSQGSLIAMLASTEGIDNYISLAGASKRIDDTMIEQFRLQNGDSIANLASGYFKELDETGKIEKLAPDFRGIFNPLNQKFFKTWMAYKPTDEISKFDGFPMLVLNGTKDLQVFESDAKALYNANPKAELKLIENMNHVLKTITEDKDNLKSYYSPDYPLSDELVNIITEFIKR
jgi:fermentation-respiration switch protein FrsA (DUF1100 family)